MRGKVISRIKYQIQFSVKAKESYLLPVSNIFNFNSSAFYSKEKKKKYFCKCCDFKKRNFRNIGPIQRKKSNLVQHHGCPSEIGALSFRSTVGHTQSAHFFGAAFARLQMMLLIIFNEQKLFFLSLNRI